MIPQIIESGRECRSRADISKMIPETAVTSMGSHNLAEIDSILRTAICPIQTHIKIVTAAISPMGLAAIGMHHIYHGFQVVDRGVLQHPMPQVENVAVPALGSSQDFQDA